MSLCPGSGQGRVDSCRSQEGHGQDTEVVLQHLTALPRQGEGSFPRTAGFFCSVTVAEGVLGGPGKCGCGWVGSGSVVTILHVNHSLSFVHFSY